LGPFSLEMNRLRCEDIVEATLVAAVTAAARGYGVEAKIALKLSSLAMRAIERSSVFVGMVATLKVYARRDINFLDHCWFFNALLLSQVQSRLNLRRKATSLSSDVGAHTSRGISNSVKKNITN
jgi:hypothetical protein